MNYRGYVVTTSAPYDQVLEDWRWLTGPTLRLWCITKAGDAFLRDPADGSIHFLDVMGGKVERIADNEAGFEAAVGLPENYNRWLMPEVVDCQALLGMKPGKNECLSFKIPPVLGGKLHPDNLETCNVLVHFGLAGQIHLQVKDLPPGTKIGKVIFEGSEEEPDPPSRPWWKFW